MSYEQQIKHCQNCKQSFTIESEDFSFYEKMQVPPPTFCPACRMQRRFAFRNQNKLFKATNAFTGEQIFSLVPPQANIPVITPEQWFSDSWSGNDYAMDIDFSKPFLEQLFKLHAKIPQINLNVTRMVNSPYSGNANDLRNCYMVFNAARDENCLYGTGYYGTKDSVDNIDIYDSELCYENFWTRQCNRVFFSEECTQCADVWFSKNCIGCTDCIGCVNLKNKSNCIFNVQYDKESYEREKAALHLTSYEALCKLRLQAFAFWKKFPRKCSQGIKNTAVTGVYVTHSKNVHDSYLVEQGEDIRYSQFISQPPNKDSYDISVWGDGTERAYEYSSSGSGVYNCKFMVDCWPNMRDTEYSLHCSSSANLFGCVGLRNASYCILNKQYAPEEYTKLVQRIKEQMTAMPYVDSQGLSYPYGEFFPIEFSWYGYNNTLAQEFFPLTSDTAKNRGYTWYEKARTGYRITQEASTLPDTIGETEETVCSEVIKCATCASAYRIAIEEYAFLRKLSLPLPHLCPDCRHTRRLERRLKPALYANTCMHEGCHNTFFSPYPPESDDIVYCESCYQKEVE